MQTKIFTADSADAVIKMVNDWLARETGIAVRKTETCPPEPRPGEPVEFRIWYDRDAEA